MGVTALPRLPNQGQMLAFGWNNQAQLKNITALLGTDNLAFIPLNDRDYAPGVTRQMTTGGVLYSGMPIINPQSPWISDGQIEFLYIALGNSYSGNVTYRGHTPLSVGQVDVFTYNAILNMRPEQLTRDKRRHNGWDEYDWQIVITEVL